MALTLDDQADVRIQLATALVGAISGAVRGLRARVTEAGTLMLIAYFDRVPLNHEVEVLQDAVGEAAVSLYRTRLRSDTRVVVTHHAVLGLPDLEVFEEREFGFAPFRFWAYARHGETPGDEEDMDKDAPIAEGRYTRLT